MYRVGLLGFYPNFMNNNIDNVLYEKTNIYTIFISIIFQMMMIQSFTLTLSSRTIPNINNHNYWQIFVTTYESLCTKFLQFLEK